MADTDDGQYGDGTGGDPFCTWCDGAAWEECGDPIQCCDPACDGETHPCPACNGTGLAAHQVMW